MTDPPPETAQPGTAEPETAQTLLPFLERILNALLAGRGLSLLPQARIDEWLREKLGEGVRLEGERVVIEHAALAARLRRGKARA